MEAMLIVVIVALAGELTWQMIRVRKLHRALAVLGETTEELVVAARSAKTDLIDLERMFYRLEDKVKARGAA